MKQQIIRSMQHSLDPAKVAQKYVDEVRTELKSLAQQLRVVGFVASDDLPSITYANATQQKFTDVGIAFDLQRIARLDLEDAIIRVNEDPEIHGQFVYLPVFNNEQDVILRNLVDFRKDIEGGSQYWTRKLYSNDRLAEDDDHTRKALLPCTPLAIIKMLTEAGIYRVNVDLPMSNKVVTVFNRSEVVGRPLAAMLSNDGARVYSFDINGPLEFYAGRPAEIEITRQEALAQSDIVITGVPSETFQKVSATEIKNDTACLNFSFYANFDEDMSTHAGIYIPRIGPVTVAMCMRNTLRLYKNFHQSKTHDQPG
jgi:methylenetetrahydrofolate dehydrogenase (NADP+)/methenyltetrahydrofolate cyclohydrolase